MLSIVVMLTVSYTSISYRPVEEKNCIDDRLFRLGCKAHSTCGALHYDCYLRSLMYRVQQNGAGTVHAVCSASWPSTVDFQVLKD